MIGLDTSFLLAAEGRDAREKWRLAGRVLARAEAAELIVPAQAVAEMLHVLKAVHGVGEAEAGEAAAGWLQAATIADISPAIVVEARALSDAAPLPVDQALMVVAARAAGARLLLSDDLPAGFTHGALRVVNPFARSVDPALEGWLGPGWSNDGPDA